MNTQLSNQSEQAKSKNRKPRKRNPRSRIKYGFTFEELLPLETVEALKKVN